MWRTAPPYADGSALQLGEVRSLSWARRGRQASLKAARAQLTQTPTLPRSRPQRELAMQCAMSLSDIASQLVWGAVGFGELVDEPAAAAPRAHGARAARSLVISATIANAAHWREYRGEPSPRGATIGESGKHMYGWTVAALFDGSAAHAKPPPLSTRPSSPAAPPRASLAAASLRKFHAAAASSAVSSYLNRGRWCSSCRSSTIGAGGWRTGRAGCRSRPFGTQLLASCPGRTMPCSLGRAALGMNSLFSRGYWLPLSGRWLESSTDCDARPANQNK